MRSLLRKIYRFWVGADLPMYTLKCENCGLQVGKRAQTPSFTGAPTKGISVKQRPKKLGGDQAYWYMRDKGICPNCKSKITEELKEI